MVFRKGVRSGSETRQEWMRGLLVVLVEPDQRFDVSIRPLGHDANGPATGPCSGNTPSRRIGTASVNTPLTRTARRSGTVMGDSGNVGTFGKAGGLPDGESPTGPSDAPVYRYPLSATVRLTAEGPEPAVVTINVGGRVTFLNDDARPHEIASDPYLRHEECPAINFVGFLAPRKQGVTRIFEKVWFCGFHDHLDPTGISGRIDVRIE